jgi:L-ascorbate metabolism protein UlaG (beta-lactamase superfamily)
MMEREVYLKQNVLVEPLFNQWYAWSCLISPATAALFVANSHLKIMQSFVNSPQIHIAANKNPAMRGGPFINFGADRVPQIKALAERTSEQSRPLLGLAADFQALDEMLKSEATGYSIEPLYQKVPDSMKGYVELTYDLNNQPSYRLIEGLLYKSPYYDEAAQSICLSLIHRDDRAFALSTPVLEEPGRLMLKVPFRCEGLDELFKMKSVPQPYGRIKEILGITDQQDELFSTFFTETAPQQAARYKGEGVRIRYFGHACVLIETSEVSILCDPVISYECAEGIERYTYAELPDQIDYVLITHNHQDHLMFETLLQLRHKIGHIVVPKNNGGSLPDPSLKLVLQNIGFRHVIELDELEAIEVPGGSINGLPFLGEHADLNIRTKLSYLMKLKDNSILCAADSNNIEPRLYEHLKKAYGELDVLFLGMECDGAPLSWLYGPLLTKPLTRKMDQSRRYDGSDYEKAIDIIDKLNPRAVYVYAMGQEPWLTYLTSIQYTDESRPIIESNKLVEGCRSRGIISERLYGHKEIFLQPD